jgi:protein-L-isoaspartate(D-aspartate) O-methyltransferase
LTPAGRIVAPVGGLQQQLIVATKDGGGRVHRTVKEAVRFVPLRGGVA